MAILAEIGQDSRFGARTLLRNPGFAATVILTLALATGATAAIFSVVNSVLLRPLPFGDPDRLVQVYGRNWANDRAGLPDPMTAPVGSTELEAFGKQSTTVEAFAGYTLTTRHLEGPSGVERLTAVWADGAFFSTLGVEAVAGRTFRADDPLEVAVISASLWRRRFDGDPSLPGKSIALDGRPFTVLGVMPDSFQFPYGAASGIAGALTESRTDLWIPITPLRVPSGQLRRGRSHVTARLKRGVTIEAAAAELRVIATRLEAQSPAGTRLGVRLVPLAEDVLGPVRRSLWMMFAAAGLVLAAACANVANLLLSRMTARVREVVTRAALGADRMRLVRQFLVESLLLSLTGGLCGVAIARWGMDLLVALGSARIPRAHEVTLDWRVFGFLLLVCLATAVLFGLAPALAAARVDAQAVTKESGGHATMGRTYGRIRDGLVVVEVALAFVLALGAAIVMRESTRLQRVETGMAIENVLALHLTPRAPASDYYAIEQRVAQLPGVQAAGFTQLVPLQNWGWDAAFQIRGRPSAEWQTTGLRYVTPGYFRALGIPLLRGRALTEGDRPDAPRVILVNDAFARRYFPGEEAVGRELDRGTIVGVVGDVRQVGLDRPPEPELYYPAAQNVAMASDIGMSLIVRTAAAPERATEAIRAAVRDLNPGLAIFNVKTMEQVVADSLWELNLYRWLIGLFAALAVVLAAIGLYGVISYSVTSRMREFAVRLALGSDPLGLARLVLRHGAWLTAAGLAAGILGALAVRPWLARLSAGLGGDPATVRGDRGAAARDRARRVRPPGDPRRPREPRRRAPARLGRCAPRLPASRFPLRSQYSGPVMVTGDSGLMALARTIAGGDAATALRLLAKSPMLASARAEDGATRQEAKTHFLDGIQHYVYAGDTALHIAAAAYRLEIVQRLIAMGGDVRARNRRGAEPLHYAADGGPGSRTWNPSAQAATVACLIEAGADPNTVDRSGVTPLHRAVRTRCAAAVSALLDGGADARRRNKSGSTPMRLATRNTGRGGSGSPEAKAQQEEIRRLLARHGAAR